VSRLRWAIAPLFLLLGCAQPGPYTAMETLQFEAIAAPEGVRYATVGAHRVAYWDQGTGPLVVLVHGLGEHAGYWTQTVQALAKTHRVIALDLLGYGRSDKPATGYGMRAQAQLILGLLDAVAPAVPATLVGHSMGGQISLRLALGAPERIKHLVLLAPAGIERFTPGEGAWLKRVSTPALFKSRTEQQLRAHFMRNVFHRWGPEAEHHLQERVRLRGAAEFDAYLRAVVGGIHGMVDEPVADALSTLEVPSTVVFGDRDGLIPNAVLHGGTVAEIATLAKDIPGADIRVWPEVGHMIQLEAPEETWAIIRRVAGD
jgi:pimeloyl-ACP methyl ester carboxylesterase